MRGEDHGRVTAELVADALDLRGVVVDLLAVRRALHHLAPAGHDVEEEPAVAGDHLVETRLDLGPHLAGVAVELVGQLRRRRRGTRATRRSPRGRDAAPCTARRSVGTARARAPARPGARRTRRRRRRRRGRRRWCGTGRAARTRARARPRRPATARARRAGPIPCATAPGGAGRRAARSRRRAVCRPSRSFGSHATRSGVRSGSPASASRSANSSSAVAGASRRSGSTTR